MANVVKSWYKRHFSNPQTTVLILFIAFLMAMIMVLGKIMVPVFVSVVLAYLLWDVKLQLDRVRCPHMISVTLLTVLLIGGGLVFLLWLFPLLWQQFVSLMNQVPVMFQQGQKLLAQWSVKYPQYLSIGQLQRYASEFSADLAQLGRYVLSYSLASIPGVIEFVVYVVLVPLMVFFMLKDKTTIFKWMKQFLPKNRMLVKQVWGEVDFQLGNYIRAKVIELFIVAIVTSLFFAALGFNYSFLLGFLTGLSTLVPYIGVIVVTIPVVALGLMQWGLTTPFAWLVIGFLLIMILDGNLLAPLLFAGTLEIHPLAAIIAVIFFGGLWGFWGVFFAIPLAIIVKAIIKAWP